MALKVYSQDYSQYHGQYQTWAPGGGHLNDAKYGGWILRVPGLGVSVGSGELSIQQTSPRLPPVVPSTTSRGSVSIPAATTGSAPSSIQTHVPTRGAPLEMVNETLYATTQEQYAKLKALYPNNPVIYQPSYVPPAPAVTETIPATKPTGEPQVSDLGNLAVDLLRTAGTAYINRELAPQPVGYAPPVITAGAALTDQIGIPFVDVIPNQPSDCGDYVYKKVCGEYKWVKKRRRRRRPIATNAEIGQVQAISSVLKGDNLKVWLAKRA